VAPAALLHDVVARAGPAVGPSLVQFIVAATPATTPLAKVSRPLRRLLSSS
jgi:hypothetical protein